MIDDGAKRRTKPERPRNVPKVAPELEGLLSAEDLEAIRAKAHTAARDEQKQKAKDQVYQRELEMARREFEPEQELRPIMIDLAPFAKNIMLDGVQYHHGQVYNVTGPQYAVLMETMARGWAHDEEVGSPNRKSYQKPAHVGTGNYAGVRPAAKDTVLSPRAPGGMTAQQRGV